MFGHTFKKLSTNVSNMSTNKYRPSEKMKYKAFGCVEIDDESTSSSCLEVKNSKNKLILDLPKTFQQF
jgi:hypothetical protein